MVEWTERYGCHETILPGNIRLSVAYDTLDDQRGHVCRINDVTLKQVSSTPEEGKRRCIKYARAQARILLEVTED